MMIETDRALCRLFPHDFTVTVITPEWVFIETAQERYFVPTAQGEAVVPVLEASEGLSPSELYQEFCDATDARHDAQVPADVLTRARETLDTESDGYVCHSTAYEMDGAHFDDVDEYVEEVFEHYGAVLTRSEALQHLTASYPQITGGW